MSRIAKGFAAASVTAVLLAGFTACGAAQVAMAPHPAGSHAPASHRPVWDGTGAYTSMVEPLCPASSAGEVRWPGPLGINSPCGATVTGTCTHGMKRRERG